MCGWLGCLRGGRLRLSCWPVDAGWLAVVAGRPIFVFSANFMGLLVINKTLGSISMDASLSPWR